jgi:ribosome-binding protein aMBF1 (putative translation factor)
MKVSATCDICGKILAKEEIFFSISEPDLDYCKKCHQEAELESLQSEVKQKTEWLENTHLRTIRELKERIVVLRGVNHE